MAELIAVGKNNQQRCWPSLPEHEPIMLGRAPRQGLSVPWDPLISREHAHLTLNAGRLTVRELETARNPILLGGRPSKQFSIEPQGEFIIGETRFRFEVREPVPAERQTVAEHVLDGKGEVAHFEDASACLAALCQLPGLMARAQTDADFAAQVVELLLQSLRGSLAAAVLQFNVRDDQTGDEPTLIRWSSRDEAVQRFRPSRRLMRRAFDEGRSVVHLWTGDANEERPEFTMSSNLDWAFCTPIRAAGHDRWCLYVSGRRQFMGLRDIESADDLLAELRLAELMAQFIGAVRQVRVLEQQHGEMRQFFSPAVVETLISDRCSADLEPRQGLVSVLFCDVRGFSQKVEESSDDLHALLARVREALSVMTRNILKYEGVIADFQGDAALGFWGWPSPNDDSALSACRAALAIHNTFAAAQHDVDHPLHGFRVGIGICHGEAIAGRIGSDEQIKVGVFGPVVNRASRLQDLTKTVGAPILMDGPTGVAVRGALPSREATLRRVTLVRPPGISTPVEVFALTSALGDDSGLSETELKNFERAVAEWEAGDWAAARNSLKLLPAQDGPANFLRMAMAELGDAPPDGWDGALSVGHRSASPPVGLTPGGVSSGGVSNGDPGDTTILAGQ